MPVLDQVIVQLSADIGQFQTGMAAANTSVQNFTNAAHTATGTNRTFYEGMAQAGEYAAGSERGVRLLERGMGALAVEAVGTNHAVGQLAEGLLLFGGGSTIVLTVLAGVVAIGNAYEQLTAAAREDEKAQADLIKALDKLGEHAQLTALRIQIAALQEHIADLKRETTDPTFWESLKNAFTLWGEGAKTFDVQLIDSQAQLAGLLTQLGTLERRFEGKELEKSERAHEAAGRAAWRHHEALVALTRQLEQVLAPLEMMWGWLDQIANLAPNLAGMDEALGSALGRELDLQWSRTLKQQKDIERQVHEWGGRIARALVDGISGNLSSLGDLLKSILEAWIQQYLIEPFLLSLGIFSPSAFGTYVGSMVVQGIGAGMQGTPGMQNLTDLRLNLHVNVSGGTATNPFAAARDQDWQRAFRETALVAHADGFRVPS